MTSVRSFIALPIPTSVQLTLGQIQYNLKETHTDVKWDSPDKFHITLKFLGNVDISIIEPLSVALSESLKSIHPFDITFTTIGAFPDLHHPRIVWIGIEQSNQTLNLQFIVEKVCNNFGFPKEDRAFHPHITLGRVKGTHNLGRLTDAIKTITFEPVQSHCSDVLLMKSELRPSGSIYTILKSFSLYP
jgi:2'-5' RNA ligase